MDARHTVDLETAAFEIDALAIDPTVVRQNLENGIAAVRSA